MLHIHVLMLYRKFELIPIKIEFFMNFLAEDIHKKSNFDWNRLKFLHNMRTCISIKKNYKN